MDMGLGRSQRITMLLPARTGGSSRRRRSRGAAAGLGPSVPPKLMPGVQVLQITSSNDVLDDEVALDDDDGANRVVVMSSPQAQQ